MRTANGGGKHKVVLHSRPKTQGESARHTRRKSEAAKRKKITTTDKEQAK